MSTSRPGDTSTVFDSLAMRVYDVLVERAGALDDESNRAQFHHFWRERDQYREFRFIGSLGFGGKFWCDSRGRAWHVDCYREDETELRKLTIKVTNEWLADLESLELEGVVRG